jgi:hypothetical protein
MILVLLVSCQQTSKINYDNVQKTIHSTKNVITTSTFVANWPTINLNKSIDDTIPKNIIIDAISSYKFQSTQLDSIERSSPMELTIENFGHYSIKDDLRAYHLVISEDAYNYGILFIGVYNQNWFNKSAISFKLLSSKFQAEIISTKVSNDTLMVTSRYFNPEKTEKYVSSSYNLNPDGLIWCKTEFLLLEE